MSLNNGWQEGHCVHTFWLLRNTFTLIKLLNIEILFHQDILLHTDLVYYFNCYQYIYVFRFIWMNGTVMDLCIP